MLPYNSNQNKLKVFRKLFNSEEKTVLYKM